VAQSDLHELGHVAKLTKVFLLLFLQKKKTLPYLFLAPAAPAVLSVAA